MRQHLRLLALVLGGAAMVAFQVFAKPRPDPETIAQQARAFTDTATWRGRVAPDFELTMLDGTRMRLAEHVGREVIVLNFFATWCGPCRAEIPELERFHRAHSSEGVLLVGIDAEEKHTAVEGFVRDLKFTYPVGIDGTGDIGKLYDVSAYPTTVVIGADGRVKVYEVSAIANADVSLGGVITPEIAAIHAGRGITADAYREALAREPSHGPDAGPTVLTGRALHIAETMTCPCGCEDKVNACSCNTSKGIRAKLAREPYEGKTDVEVIEALNREFCVRDK
jgi:thiol-disulfide isomerase/thioredoxin